MPYERKGKCIQNKETGKDMGCSKTTAKAKAHLKALYANEPEKLKEMIHEIVRERLSQENLLKEGKLGTFLSGLGLIAALVGYNYLTNSTDTMKALNAALEKAEQVGDEAAVKKIEDMITKQQVWQDTGQGEDQLGNLDEKLVGGQKKLDANKDGKISKEDFKLLKSKPSVKEGGEGRTENYMFFSNLEQMKRQIEILMRMDPTSIDMILQNGHDWADDHISEAKTNMDQVFDFIMNEIK